MKEVEQGGRVGEGSILQYGNRLSMEFGVADAAIKVESGIITRALVAEARRHLSADLRSRATRLLTIVS